MRISWPPPSRVLPSRRRVVNLGIVDGDIDVFCFGSGSGFGQTLQSWYPVLLIYVCLLYESAAVIQL